MTGRPAPPCRFDADLPNVRGWRTRRVRSPGQFPAALEAAAVDRAANARPHRILIDPGVTLPPFTLPGHAHNGHWITVESAGALPPPGTRVGASDAGQMARVVTPDTGAAITTAPGAGRFRLVGLEITHAPSAVPENTRGGQATVFHLCDFGSGARRLEELPEAIILDRCHLHGQPRRNLTRAVSMHARGGALVDCRVEEVQYRDNDSQAVCGWNGPGPYLLRNCHLSAAGENVMFGGADPEIAGMVPADIEIDGCHFTKPTSWFRNDHNPAGDYAGIPYPIKNLLELKMARRVWVHGCVFEHNCGGQGQNGYAILLRGGNDSGRLPHAVCEDVRFEWNVVRHVGGGVALVGPEDSRGAQRVLIRQNLWWDLSSRWGGGEGKWLQVLHGPDDVWLDHNTSLPGRYIGYFGEDPSNRAERFRMTNNVVAIGTDPGGARGLIGSGTGQGNETLAVWTTDGEFSHNGLIGDGRVYRDRYPGDSVWAPDEAAAGFEDAAGGDYRLRADSPLHVPGTDGLPLGCDVAALEALLRGVAG